VNRWLEDRAEASYRKTMKWQAHHVMNARLATALGLLEVYRIEPDEKYLLLAKRELFEAKLSIAEYAAQYRHSKEILNQMRYNFWMLLLAFWELVSNLAALLVIGILVRREKEKTGKIDTQQIAIEDQRCRIIELEKQLTDIQITAKTNAVKLDKQDDKLDKIIEGLSQLTKK
jgi:hypothetical protein